jgi:hypothetical protein
MVLVVGNAVKAGVRFISYDHFKQMLADSEVSWSVALMTSNTDDDSEREK